MHHLSSFIICSHNIFQVRYKTDQQCCGFHPSPQPSGWRLHLTHTFSHKNALKLSIKKYEPLMVYLDRWTTFIISCESLASFFFPRRKLMWTRDETFRIYDEDNQLHLPWNYERKNMLFSFAMFLFPCMPFFRGSAMFMRMIALFLTLLHASAQKVKC